MTSLQANVSSDTARLQIITLIGNVYTLQVQLSTGKVDKASFSFFVTNIQKGLKQIRALINADPAVDVANKHISAIERLLNDFQKVTSSGDQKKIGVYLQTILNQLTKLQGDVADFKARNVIISLIGNIFVLKGQMAAGQVEASAYKYLISNIQSGIKQVRVIVNASSGGSSSTTTTTSNGGSTVTITSTTM